MFWRRVRKIGAKEAKALAEESNVTFVDVRLPKHFRKSNIPGALNANRKTVHGVLNLEDKAAPIVCYCYSGFSSKTACRNLERAGYLNVYNLKGGYPAWKRAAGGSEP